MQLLYITFNWLIFIKKQFCVHSICSRFK
jgi:hypothetical protein